MKTSDKILKPLDYIFVLRPTLFFPVWTVFLSGFFVQQKFGTSVAGSNDHTLVLGHLHHTYFWVGLSLTFLMGAVFILNQIEDRVTDHQNRKLFLIAHGHLTPKAAAIEAAILIVPSLIFAFVFAPLMGLLFLALLLFTGLIYSHKPFSWKDKPLLGLLTNILGAYLIFIGGWIVAGKVNRNLMVHALPYAAAVAAVYLYTTLPDLEGDAASKKVTFGVKYGFNATVYCGLLFETLSVIAAYMLNDEIIFYPAFFSWPFFMWAAIKLKPRDVIRAIKYPILLLSLTVCIKLPNYFFLLVGVYFISKVYYKLRFGLDYPNMAA
ncbi:MAG: UbiA family prenyltransferase [bacterium]